ncbi:MAG: hypothetical protein JO323_04745 [Acidobacteriia bacterium]|nr:hypothetical protein [Terriglobia bacterium]
MDVQHFRVKVFATPDSRPHLSDAIPVFHRWIQHNRVPETAIDVSDYEHVPNGPGIILVCYEAIYGLDQGQGQLGLMYNRRTVLDGSNADRLRQAIKAAQTAATALEQEPEFAGRLGFDRKRWEVAVNDRALAPNTGETWDELSPVIREVFDEAIGADRYSLERHGDPRELFRVTIQGS